MRRQAPLKGGREPIWGALDPQVRAWVLRTAAKDGCSRSMVVNNALGWVAGVKLADPLPRRRVRR